MATTFAQLQAEVSAVLGIDDTDESTNAARFTKAGLRAISRAGAWEWLHTYYSTGITTTTGDYDYALPTDLYRLDTRSVRTGGRESYLGWRNIRWIDGHLGVDWKDSGSDNGTPEYVTRLGNNLWIATKPSLTWVTANAKLYFYYWLTEVSSGTLYLPDEYLDVAVQAALIYGMISEDDPRADSMLQRWQQVYLPELRGSKLDMHSGDQVLSPSWFDNTDDSGGTDAGDGYYW